MTDFSSFTTDVVRACPSRQAPAISFLSDDMGQTAEGVIEAVFSCLMFEENKASSQRTSTRYA